MMSVLGVAALSVVAPAKPQHGQQQRSGHGSSHLETVAAAVTLIGGDFHNGAEDRCQC
jgi:hypothetical protein